MIPLHVAEVAAVVAGRADADGDALVESVVTDSRTATPGSLFVAVAGDQVDGHAFVADALSLGAVCALVSAPVEGPHILVPDTVEALGLLAAEVVRRSSARVIAVTGSSGKTTTKDLLAQVLSRHGETVAPVGSYNNEIGVPLTACNVTRSTDYLVLEMSARDVGHIRYLTGIARPSIAVVLNVGVAHLGVFGSRARIAEAKGELVESLTPQGIAVLNADDPAVAAMASRSAGRVVLYGDARASAYRATGTTLDVAGRPHFTLQTPYGDAPVELPLVGEHMVGNALACAAVACEVGMPVELVGAALTEARAASRWRMEVRRASAGFTVINDAYNANTESMFAALKALKSLPGRSWAVLGPMAELGDSATDEHARVGQLVVRLGINKLVTVGPGAKVIHDAFLLEGSLPDDAIHVEDVDAAVAFLTSALREGDVVLVKASRAAGLERIALSLIPDGGST